MEIGYKLVGCFFDTASQCYRDLTSKECRDQLPGVERIFAIIGFAFMAYKSVSLLNNLRLKVGLSLGGNEPKEENTKEIKGRSGGAESSSKLSDTEFIKRIRKSEVEKNMRELDKTSLVNWQNANALLMQMYWTDRAYETGGTA